jgi:hypothetical protein
MRRSPSAIVIAFALAAAVASPAMAQEPTTDAPVDPVVTEAEPAAPPAEVRLPQEPQAEEPAVDEPAVPEQPVVEEPAVPGQPVAEEPAVPGQPVAEEPVGADEPVAEEATDVEAPAIEHPPAVDPPTAVQTAPAPAEERAQGPRLSAEPLRIRTREWRKRSGWRADHRRRWWRARRSPQPVNESRTIQVVVQVQVGCRIRCDGTVQAQTAVQVAQTTQTGTVNVSVIEQFVWQLQLGCVAFCTNTVQTQTAIQVATTTQTGAVNSATTLQRIVQRQEGCRTACVGVVQTQTAEQHASTTQTALGELHVWLRTLANSAVTIQVVRQVELADCLRDCTAAPA